jgi:hypothetical protein
MTDTFAECIDCGRPVISAFSRLAAGRCADCFALPGWHLLCELRVVFEPDEDWQPPQRAPMASDPGHWQCEVPGCESTSVLLRVSRYDEPFRSRCADHLDPDIWRRLHALRNEASVL